MITAPITVALAGVGDLGRFVVEALQPDDRFRVVVLSRSKRQWFTDRGIHVELTDYSESSVLPILEATKASVLISFVSSMDKDYIDVHNGLLSACKKSDTCKRVIPSEWSGNVDDFPHLPRFYDSTRGVFRETLEKSSGVEWTLMNLGWFMDYFVPKEKTYIKPQPGWWPIDLDNWEVIIRGSGDEPQSWTSARDVAKALPELLLSPKWERTTYIVGEWSTFNQAIKTLESFYGRPMKKTYKSYEQIQSALEIHENKEESLELYQAMLDEWLIAGGSAVPVEKTLRQRETYFPKVKFLGLKELLQFTESIDHV